MLNAAFGLAKMGCGTALRGIAVVSAPTKGGGRGVGALRAFSEGEIVIHRAEPLAHSNRNLPAPRSKVQEPQRTILSQPVRFCFFCLFGVPDLLAVVSADPSVSEALFSLTWLDDTMESGVPGSGWLSSQTPMLTS